MLVEYVRLAKWVKLLKLVSLHFFDIWTSKSVRNPQFFTLSGGKRASRHNSVHFFDTSTSKSGRACILEMCFALQRRAIFHLSSGSAPAALARLLFDPPEPQIIGKKHSKSQLSYLFAHLHLLASHSFWLPTSAFPSLHAVGSLTSKLPSNNTGRFESWFSNKNSDIEYFQNHKLPHALRPC